VTRRAPRHLIVRAVLDDAALLHHEDVVGIADRREAVRDHEAGAALAQRCHRMLDEKLGAGVDRRCRLVEDQDLGIGEERPRDRHQLLLADAQVRRLVVAHRVVAAGQRAHAAASNSSSDAFALP
jgi:hypothetical protein